ncbi:hypothetical protein LCGC14_1465080 [marine sediment metagenome]|uniref:Uncharacterized protein n=1 Tax=marine sediment metagenome TaxID=412755 RepID=A0A0F9JEI9_9ZZZZ
MTNIKARNERMLVLYEEGKSNEVIQVILATEFPKNIITARTVAEKLWKMGKKAHSEGSEAKEGDPSESQRLVARMMEKAAEFVQEHKALPPVPDHIRATKLADMGFDTEQEGVALFSDLHYYSKIDRRASNGLAEYNEDIARERLIRWRDGLLRFTQMSQVVVKLNTLHILALGDDLEGHGEMFGSQALQMSESIIFQVQGFAEDMVSIILSLLQRYKHINIVKVPGNHGRTTARAKSSYTPDNFETLAWRQIAERVRYQTGGEWRETLNGNSHLEGGLVDFHIIKGAIGFIEIQGWLCALRHGQNIKGLQATYTGAIDNKLRLNSVIGEHINYYFKAHLHEAQSADVLQSSLPLVAIPRML